MWAASAIVMALGVGLAAAADHGSAGVVLSLVAPLVGAAGLAAVFGSRVDPALEVARATPTSPRLVSLARVTVVFGYDLTLALGGSVVLTAAGVSTSLPDLIDSWLGPMALLSAISLLIAVVAGANTAIAIAAGLWTARAASGATTDTPALLGAPLHDTLLAAWTTSGLTLALAAVLAAAAVAAAPRSLRVTPS